MHAEAIVAEQTSRNRYQQPFPLPPREIELTVRLEMPEGTGADVGIDAAAFLPPSTWEDSLHRRLYQGVHSGLAIVGAPLSAGGIALHNIKIRISPPLESVAEDDDVQRLGETLEALTAATVSALWTGVITLGSPSVP
jgi:hypothetical protein